MFTNPPMRLLACCLFGLAAPVSATEPAGLVPADSAYYAGQRVLLEAYVECVRARQAAVRTEMAAAQSCGSERAAYQASLPAEFSQQVLDEIEAGPKPSGLR